MSSSVDDFDEEVPEVRIQPGPGELGGQMKHYLKILAGARGREGYREKVLQFLEWFPDEELEKYLGLCLEYAVDTVGKTGKGRGRK